MEQFVPRMPLDDFDGYHDTSKEMRRVMIPAVAFIFIVVFLFLILALSRYVVRNFGFLKFVLLIHTFAQLLFSCFLLITTEWTWAVQLGMTALFGTFATITLGIDYLFIYSIVCVFNFLGLLGRLSFLSYTHSLYYLLDTHPMTCYNYFYLNPQDSERLCEGYVAFARFLSYLLVFLVAAQAFVSYYIYKERSRAAGSIAATRSDYATIETPA